MTKDNLREELAQASEEESRKLFQEMMRKCVRMALFDAMEEEVESLCGKKHHPNKSTNYYRAGSEKELPTLMEQKKRSTAPECVK